MGRMALALRLTGCAVVLASIGVLMGCFLPVASPTAVIGADHESGVVPLLVEFDASKSIAPHGRALSYEWTFEDGTKASGPVMHRGYDRPGLFIVVLTVTDEAGASDTASVTIHVDASPTAEPVDSSFALRQGTSVLHPDGASVEIAPVPIAGNATVELVVDPLPTPLGDSSIEILEAFHVEIVTDIPSQATAKGDPTIESYKPVGTAKVKIPDGTTPEEVAICRLGEDGQWYLATSEDASDPIGGAGGVLLPGGWIQVDIPFENATSTSPTIKHTGSFFLALLSGIGSSFPPYDVKIEDVHTTSTGTSSALECSVMSPDVLFFGGVAYKLTADGGRLVCPDLEAAGYCLLPDSEPTAVTVEVATPATVYLYFNAKDPDAVAWNWKIILIFKLGKCVPILGELIDATELMADAMTELNLDPVAGGSPAGMASFSWRNGTKLLKAVAEHAHAEQLVHALKWLDVAEFAASVATYFVTVESPKSMQSFGPYTVSLPVPQNKAPIADAGTGQGDVSLGKLVRLDGSRSSDPEGQTLTYSWRQSGGPPVSLAATADDPVATFTPSTAGSYQFSLVVSDGSLESAPSYVTVTVAEQPVSCSLAEHSAAPQQVQVGQSVTLSATVTNTSSAAWTFYVALSLKKPNGSQVNLDLKPLTLSVGQQGTATWNYAPGAAGAWDVYFGVWKEQSEQNSLAATGWLRGYVTVVVEPTPTCSLSVDKTSGQAPLTVTFTPSGNAQGGTFQGWTLSFGDGTQLPAASGGPSGSYSHTYTAAGTYTAILVVSNTSGKSCNSTRDIKVTFCMYALSKYDRNFTSVGGSGSFSVLTQSGCAWTATTDASPWVGVEEFHNPGSDVVTYTVSANNTGAPRTGHIFVQDQTFTVTQAAPSCTYELSPSSSSFGSAGGTDNFTVRTSLTSCSWTAAASQSWIHVISGSSGTGIGRVDFSLDPNDSSGAVQRSGSIVVADQTFSITQAAPTPPCAVTIPPQVPCVPGAGGRRDFLVQANAGCAWTASTEASWIHITAGASGVGSQNVTCQIDPNPGEARTGTVAVGGGTCTIRESQSSGLLPVARFSMSSQGNTANENGTLYLTMSPGEIVTVQLSAARSSDDTCASGATWYLDGRYTSGGSEITWTFGRIATYQVRMNVINSDGTVSGDATGQIVITGG